MDTLTTIIVCAACALSALVIYDRASSPDFDRIAPYSGATPDCPTWPPAED